MFLVRIHHQPPKRRHLFSWSIITASGAALVLAVTALIALPARQAVAATVPESCFVFDSGTNTITGYDPSSNAACLKNVSIPATIGGVPVYAIGDNSFDSAGLTAVSIPEGITSIGEEAFIDNTFTALQLPNSLTTLGSRAFNNVPLVSVSIGTNQPTTPSLVINANFLDMPTLQSVHIGNNVTAILNGSFENATSLTDLDLGSVVSTISNGAFYNVGITDLIIPASVTQLDFGVFGNCNNLKTLTFGYPGYNGPGKIPDTSSAFGNLPALETITDYGTLLQASSGFSALPSLMHLTLGPNLTTITNGAFSNSKITDLTIPASVTELDQGALSGSGYLKTLTFGYPGYNGPGKIPDTNSAFWGSLSALETLTDYGTLLQAGSGFASTSSLTHLALGPNITTIENSAFSDNKLTDLTIPDSVTALQGGAFYDSDQLKTLTFGSKGYGGPGKIDTSNSVFGDLPALETLTDNGTLLAIDASFDDTPVLQHLTIGPNVTAIRNDALRYSKLTQVTVPATVQQIGYGAFAYGTVANIHLLGDTTVNSGAFQDDPVTELHLGGHAVLDHYNTEGFQGVLAKTGEIIRLYTDDPSNPYGYVDTYETDDANADGDAFAYVVNPASYTTQYVNSKGTALAGSVTKTGDNLADYTIAANPTFDFSVYYRPGKVVAFTAPTIAGYPTPANQTITLRAGNNPVTFTYYTAAELAAQVPGTPDTGFALANKVNLMWAGLAILGVSGIAVRVARRGALLK